MSLLSEAEKQKIIEEERIRAEERAKYAQTQPQKVIVKQQRQYGCGTLLLLLLIIGLAAVFLLTWAEGERRETVNTLNQNQPSTLSTVDSSSKADTTEAAPLAITREAAMSYFQKLGFTIEPSQNADNVYVGTTPQGGAKGYNVIRLAGPTANLDRLMITGVARSDFALSNPTIKNIASFAEFFSEEAKMWVNEQIQKLPSNSSAEQKASQIINGKKFDFTYSPTTGIYLEVTGVK